MIEDEHGRAFFALFERFGQPIGLRPFDRRRVVGVEQNERQVIAEIQRRSPFGKQPVKDRVEERGFFPRLSVAAVDLVIADAAPAWGSDVLVVPQVARVVLEKLQEDGGDLPFS